MPTFNTFDSNRFTAEFGREYAASILQAGIGYEDAAYMQEIVDLTRTYQAEPKDRAWPPEDYTSVTKTELKILLAFASMSEEGRECFMTLIHAVGVQRFANQN